MGFYHHSRKRTRMVYHNNITAKDQADMWIHEGFTCYSETLYTESLLGKEKAELYIKGIRNNIQNDSPIIGKYGVRNERQWRYVLQRCQYASHH